MKYLAVVLSMFAIGLYLWPFMNAFLSDSYENGKVEKEVFPQAMMSIRPVGESLHLPNQSVQESQQQTQITQSTTSESFNNQESALMAQAEQVQTENSESVAAPQGICLKIGPLGTSQLPAINKSVEQSGLLESVSVEPVLGPDRWIVFLVPSNSEKGATIQAQQMRKKGYTNAKVIKNGPLANAVSLGVFLEEEQAKDFYQQINSKTNLQGLRVTRMIGEPTNKVFLMFTNLSQEQAKQVQGIGQRHAQKITPCF